MSDDSKTFDINIQTNATGDGAEKTIADLEKVKAVQTGEGGGSTFNSSTKQLTEEEIRRNAIILQRQSIIETEQESLRAEAAGQTELAAQLEGEVAMRRMALQIQQQTTFTDTEAMVMAQERYAALEIIAVKEAEILTLKRAQEVATAEQAVAQATLARSGTRVMENLALGIRNTRSLEAATNALFGPLALLGIVGFAAYEHFAKGAEEARKEAEALRVEMEADARHAEKLAEAMGRAGDATAVFKEHVREQNEAHKAAAEFSKANFDADKQAAESAKTLALAKIDADARLNPEQKAQARVEAEKKAAAEIASIHLAEISTQIDEENKLVAAKQKSSDEQAKKAAEQSDLLKKHDAEAGALSAKLAAAEKKLDVADTDRVTRGAIAESQELESKMIAARERGGLIGDAEARAAQLAKAAVDRLLVGNKSVGPTASAMGEVNAIKEQIKAHVEKGKVLDEQAKKQQEIAREAGKEAAETKQAAAEKTKTLGTQLKTATEAAVAADVAKGIEANHHKDIRTQEEAVKKLRDDQEETGLRVNKAKLLSKRDAVAGAAAEKAADDELLAGKIKLIDAELELKRISVGISEEDKRHAQLERQSAQDTHDKRLDEEAIAAAKKVQTAEDKVIADFDRKRKAGTPFSTHRVLGLDGKVEKGPEFTRSDDKHLAELEKSRAASAAASKTVAPAHAETAAKLDAGSAQLGASGDALATAANKLGAAADTINTAVTKLANAASTLNARIAAMRLPQ